MCVEKFLLITRLMENCVKDSIEIFIKITDQFFFCYIMYHHTATVYRFIHYCTKNLIKYFECVYVHGSVFTLYIQHMYKYISRILTISQSKSHLSTKNGICIGVGAVTFSCSTFHYFLDKL